MKIKQKFSTPEILGKIRPGLLLAWLEPMRSYFEQRGLSLPPPDSSQAIDLEKLARILLEPTADMPDEFVDSLYLIHEMAHPIGMDAIIEGARVRGLSFDPGPEPSPADIAVQAWLLDRCLLENLHICQELTRPRAFRYFSTDADPVPPFRGPTEAQLAGLEKRLGAFYEASRRGKGTRVFACRQPSSPYQPFRPGSEASAPNDQPTEWWFLIRHGMPFRRESALEDGKSATVFYRPQRHDVLVYDPLRGELRLNCCSKRERDVFLRSFGIHLFGRPDFFPGTAKYTLAPLVRRGRDCLACADVRGIERVNLKEVEFFHADAPWQRVTRKADDIFELVERAEVQWPATIEQITRATFEVKFYCAKRPRRLTIVPCNKALYGRDNDSTLLEQWLEARQFIVTDV
ncbi:MAG: hypothetical protein QOJ40_124 [Verrucomicrobiota bacterium]